MASAAFLPLIPNARLKENSECLLRACAKASFEMVHAMYDAGFVIICDIVGEENA